MGERQTNPSIGWARTTNPQRTSGPAELSRMVRWQPAHWFRARWVPMPFSPPSSLPPSTPPALLIRGSSGPWRWTWTTALAYWLLGGSAALGVCSSRGGPHLLRPQHGLDHAPRRLPSSVFCSEKARPVQPRPLPNSGSRAPAAHRAEAEPRVPLPVTAEGQPPVLAGNHPPVPRERDQNSSLLVLLTNGACWEAP